MIINMKSIELTQSQIKAKEAGASMFLFPIKNIKNNIYLDEFFIKDYAPVQKGDKDIFVQEEFEEEYSGRIIYKEKVIPDEHGLVYFEDEFQDFIPYEYLDYVWQSAQQMTKEQSRYSFAECIDFRAVRVKNICGNHKAEIMGMADYLGYIQDKFESFYNQQLKEKNINRTYEDNDYVFLAEFKK